MDINELREQIKLKKERMTEISNMDVIGEAEEREFDTLHDEVSNLQDNLRGLEAAEERKKRMAAIRTPKPTEEQKVRGRYSLIRAMRGMVDGNLDGVEKEMHEEAVKEARESGISLSGLGVPSMVRGLTVGSGTSAGNFVEDEQMRIVELLRPRLLVEELGARVLSGLRGDVPITSVTGGATSSWKTEVAAAGESTQTTSKTTLTPKRNTTYTKYSRQLLYQASPDVEAFVRDDLEMAVKIAVDSACINGSGTSPEPTGILNWTGIGSVALGTNGAAPTFDSIVDLETEVAIDNADMGALAYLTTPGVRGFLKKTKIDAGSGQFVWGQGSKELNGYRAYASTQVPSTLTKGTGTALNAIIFGNFADLILANWAGLDIIVDPYSSAKTAEIEMTIHSWWDVFIRHAESFAAIVDADIS